MNAKYWSENTKGRDYLEYTGIDGMIIFKQIFREQRWVGVDWSNSGQGLWLALVNTVRNIQVP
jgi:hypothetical protein